METKAVWVLERWISKEELQRYVDIMAADRVCNARSFNMFSQALQDHPNGFWCGCVGKCDYNDFVLEARKYIKGSPENPTLRVVRADIPMDSDHWAGYTSPVNHPEVLRYLYQTM